MNLHTNLDLTGLRPACRKLPGLNREKTRITPRLSETSGAQQRKNVNYRAFRNVGYNKCRDAHRGRMFRLLWTFVDLKLPSTMPRAIHKIASKERCQSYFIDGCQVRPIRRDARYKNRVEHLDGCLRTSEAGSLYFCMARSYATYKYIKMK